MRNLQIKMTFRVGQSTESSPPHPQTEHIYFGEGGQPIPSSEWWAQAKKLAKMLGIEVNGDD